LPKKSLGQNFLIDKNIIKKIINLSNIRNRHVIEIGPGNGELTDEIIKNKPKSITLIE
jgi:16S rRNA (adenine1518-N6/adenine1519-N6)-dimethyltransferase